MVDKTPWSWLPKDRNQTQSRKRKPESRCLVTESFLSIKTHVSDEELLQVANVTTTQATPDFLQTILVVDELLASTS